MILDPCCDLIILVTIWLSTRPKVEGCTLSLEQRHLPWDVHKYTNPLHTRRQQSFNFVLAGTTLKLQVTCIHRTIATVNALHKLNWLW